MYKTEESSLLELQDLALEYKSSKRQKSLEEKQMIVKAHLLNHVPISQLCVDFGIGKKTIYRWIDTFAARKGAQQKEVRHSRCQTKSVNYAEEDSETSRE